VLPHLAVGEIAAAVQDAQGLRVYVCNIMTQPGETDGMDAVTHLDRLLEMAPGGVDVVVVHSGDLEPAALAHYAAQGQEPVAVNAAALGARGVRVVAADIAEDDQAVRHSPEALAEVLEPLAREGSARRAESASAYPA
jgi:uncharacterized cofD-like protein